MRIPALRFTEYVTALVFRKHQLSATAELAMARRENAPVSAPLVAKIHHGFLIDDERLHELV